MKSKLVTFEVSIGHTNNHDGTLEATIRRIQRGLLDVVHDATSDSNTVPLRVDTVKNRTHSKARNS